MASAINEGKITPQTTYVDKGYVKIGGYTISNFQKQIWGECSMTKVLERSINTGAVFAEEQLGDDLFLKYLENFDFFEETGIDLQGEVFSPNSEFKKGYEVNFATASFGQGIEMTPIQLVKAFCSIANGGRLVKPYLVEKIVNGSDDVIEVQPEISENPIITQTTASQVTAMMVSTIENGYGKKAQIPGYYIAGKTGTAQIAYSSLGEKKSGYSEKTIQSFIGFAPAYNPQFLILVKFTDPKAESAAYSVAPVFHEMAKYIIDYWQIPPDYE
jgi:cell division protein FtsI/penicillin-binding protein 2